MDPERESETEISPPPPRRWFQACAGIIGLFAVVYLLAPSLLIPPVQLIAEIEAPDGVKIIARADARDDPRTLRRDDLIQDLRITITATGEKNPASAGTLVFVADPTWTSGSLLERSQFKTDAGWRRWRMGGRWESSPKAGQSAKLTYRGRATESVIIPFTKLPSAGIVLLQINDEPPRRIDLYAKSEEWHVEKVFPSPRRDRYVARLPFSCSDITLRVAAKEGAASQPVAPGVTVRRVQIVWGEFVLFDRQEPFTIDGTSVRIGSPPVSDMYLRYRAAWHLAVRLLRSVPMNALALLLGLPLVWPVLGRLRPLERYAVAWSAGFAAPLVISISLTHLTFTGHQAYRMGLVALSLALIVMVVLSLAGGDGKLRLLRLNRSELRTLLGISAIVTCLMPLAFGPLSAYPNWYLGQSYTDTHYYFNSAAAFGDESLSVLRDPVASKALPNEHLVIDLLGYTDRSGDFLSLTNAAYLLHVDPRAAYAQVHLAIWSALPLIAYCLFVRLGCQKSGVWIGVGLTAGSAAILAIFTQNYVAQFLFVGLMLQVLLLAIVFLNERQVGTLTARGEAKFIVPLSVLMAASAGIYPSQFLIPASLGVIMLQESWRGRSLRPLVWLVLLGVATAVVSNVGLLPAMSANKDALPFLKMLNEIARYVVFPFFEETSRFLAISVGMHDWVLHSQWSQDIFREIRGDGSPLWLAAQGLARLWRPLFLIGAALSVVGLLAASVRSAGSRLLAATVVIYLLFAGLLLAKDQTYPYGKQIITCGVLLLICLIVGIDAALRSSKRVYRVGALVFVALFALLNARAIWFDNSVYLISSHHPLLLAMRTHVGAVDEDLRELANTPLPETIPAAPAPVAIVGKHLPGLENDRYKIVAGHISEAFAMRRLIHNPPRSVWLRERPPLALVYHGFELPAEARPTGVVFSNPTFTLYTLDTRPAPATSSAPTTNESPTTAP